MLESYDSTIALRSNGNQALFCKIVYMDSQALGNIVGNLLIPIVRHVIL